MVSSIAIGLAALLATAAATDAIILRSADVLLRPYASLLLPAVDDIGLLVRRSSSPSSSYTNNANSTLGDVPLNPDGTLNVTAWDAATTAACVARLDALPGSSNPSGICICYNLPSLDAGSGAFAADLRLFRVSDPTGDFAGVAPEDVKVGLAYEYANVSKAEEQDLTSNGGKRKRASDGPDLIQSYMFVGKIHPDQMSDNLSIATLEALVMPILTLTANTSTTSAPARTTVSPNEAAFLTGVFSASVVMSNFSAAQAAVASATAALKNGTVPFVMPGTQLLILPIGASITGAWLLAGLAAVGFGTLERMRFAESYRRRQGLAGRTATF